MKKYHVKTFDYLQDLCQHIINLEKIRKFDLYHRVKKCYNCTLCPNSVIQSIAAYEGFLFLISLVTQEWVIGTKMGTAVY